MALGDTPSSTSFWLAPFVPSLLAPSILAPCALITIIDGTICGCCGVPITLGGVCAIAAGAASNRAAAARTILIWASVARQQRRFPARRTGVVGVGRRRRVAIVGR